MTAHDSSMLRTIIFQNSRLDISPAAKLLRDLGHEVTPSPSVVDAMRAMQTDGIDLLVIDVDRPDESAELVDSVAGLPASQQPAYIAIFSDRPGIAADARRDRGASANVRVFLKPLHLHGLLGIVRKLERNQTAPSA